MLDQVRDAIRRRHYSHRTEDAYIFWIKRYVYFNNKRHPREPGTEHVTAFLNYLARGRGVATARAAKIV